MTNNNNDDQNSPKNLAILADSMGFAINEHAEEYISKLVAAETTGSTREKLLRVAAREHKHILAKAPKRGVNPRDRAVTLLENENTLASIKAKKPKVAKEPKLSKAAKASLKKWGGAKALLDAANEGKAPDFIDESNDDE